MRVIGQRLVAIGAMLGTLAFAFLLERYLLGPAYTRAVEDPADPSLMWLLAASWLLLAGCFVGLATLLPRIRHDQVVAAAYVVVGGIVVLSHPVIKTLGWAPDWLDWLWDVVTGRNLLVFASGAFIAVLGAAALASRGRRGAY
jgi:hypothetical protein